MNDINPQAAKKLLQWVQRQAGISRRKAQELIESGEVSVNDASVTDPFIVVAATEIRRLSLRGYPLSLDPPEFRVYRYHKPPGVLCSHDDPHSGNTVGRILRTEGFIGYTWVGRLDQDAEGLLLLTNDGDLVHAATHPRYQVGKVYRVWLQSMPSPSEMERLLTRMKAGIVDNGDRLRILDGAVERRPMHVRITLTEGKKHEIKRLFAHFGLSVTRLLRISIGPISLGDLHRGGIVRLNPAETAALRELAQNSLRTGPGSGKGSGASL